MIEFIGGLLLGLSIGFVMGWLTVPKVTRKADILDGPREEDEIEDRQSRRRCL